MKFRVSAIVPAYNKEQKVFKVLQTLKSSDKVMEIICVYDGNDDITLNQIRSVSKIKLFHRKKRFGQAAAVAKGIEEAKGDLILLVDADIDGLTNQLIGRLINPLLKGTHDSVIGYRSSRIENSVGVPLGGERAYFSKDLLPYTTKLKK